MGPMAWALLGSGLSAGLKWWNQPDEPDHMTVGDVRKMYGETMTGLSRPIQGQLMSSVSGMRQAGGMGRLPRGAVLSGIAGAQYRAGQALGESGERVMSELSAQQRASEMAAHNQYREDRNNWGQSFAGDIGNLTQIALLSKAGFFNQPENAAGQSLNMNSGQPFSSWNPSQLKGFNPWPTGWMPYGRRN